MDKPNEPQIIYGPAIRKREALGIMQRQAEEWKTRRALPPEWWQCRGCPSAFRYDARVPEILALESDGDDAQAVVFCTEACFREAGGVSGVRLKTAGPR